MASAKHLFNEQARMKLNLAQQYDVASALRGPDNIALDPLKQDITARLRVAVLTKPVVWLDLNSGPWTKNDTKRLKDLVVRLKEYPGFRHYTAHLCHGVAATAWHPIWGGQAEKIVTILDEGRR